MKTAIFTLGAALSLCAGLAVARPANASPPTTTILCLEVSGNILPATCRAPSSRLDQREDICTCQVGGERVITPICPKGVKPPAESAAYRKARYAAVSHGSLVGATYEGQPMCVAPRNSQAGGR
jgi:hypothetical protein